MYTFINHNKHSIQISGPNKEIVRLLPGKTKLLSRYYLKYCPKYIKVVKKSEDNKAQITKSPKRMIMRKNKNTSRAKLSRKPKPMPAQIKPILDTIPEIIPDTSNICIGILSCNRLHCVKRLLESIKKNSPDNINVIVSDESTDLKVKKYLRSIKWITLLDHKERKGIVHNTNHLLHALIPYEYKLILNDDVEIIANGWEKFYFLAMKDAGFHHFCYREYSIYGANKKGETSKKINSTEVKTITTKPQGAVLAFDNLAFKHAGYYDHEFPRYGMAHVDWSNRVSQSGVQSRGFHDISNSEKFFKIHPEKTVEENKTENLRKAKQTYEKVTKRGHMFVPPISIYQSKIHIIVNSYNRPDMLDLLLTDIEKNKSKHDISVYVYDDASTIDYKPMINKHNDVKIIYQKLDKNHGKEKYWEIINRGFEDVKNSNSHFFIKLDDDVRLVDNFFNKCIAYWNNISDPSKICMNPLLDELRKGKAVWTGKNPKEVSFGSYSYWNSGWVDMMFFCEKDFFEKLKYKINPIPKTRWRKDKNKSSGVGAQLSERFTRMKFSMYQPSNTFVIHENHHSQMNSALRKNQPIVSTEVAKEKIVISMASIQNRSHIVGKVVDTLYDQCDQINIYLNDYETVPKSLKRDKIKTFINKGDIGDIGKFYPNQTNGYIFTVDDDILYPSDYVSVMINKIEQYKRKCCIGVHGVILAEKMVDYYKSRKCYHYKMAQEKDVGVHILGTGTLAFHSETISVCKEDFMHPNMADIWFGI
ncbi:MAG: glycosyltransferase family 2 protein, partial [Promethearchaeota archaeon]